MLPPNPITCAIHGAAHCDPSCTGRLNPSPEVGSLFGDLVNALPPGSLGAVKAAAAVAEAALKARARAELDKAVRKADAAVRGSDATSSKTCPTCGRKLPAARK